jgi:hypothetical protein
LHETLLPVADHFEIRGKRVHRFRADPVQTDGELEHIVRVFSACIDFTHAIDHFTERYTATEIAHAHLVAVPIDLDRIAFAHDELVDTVIDYLLEEHVDAVLGMTSVSGPADVHSCSKAYMLERVERFYRLFVISYLCLRHFYLSSSLVKDYYLQFFLLSVAKTS